MHHLEHMRRTPAGAAQDPPLLAAAAQQEERVHHVAQIAGARTEAQEPAVLLSL